MGMKHCSTHEENLALLAGGDLAAGEEERVLREHLAACEGCRQLVSELQGDLALLADLPEISVEEADSLDADVLQRLAATESPAPRRLGNSQHLRAAATILVVVTAFAGALSLQGPTAPADGGMGVPTASSGDIAAKSHDEGLPIRVYRAGDSLELEWTGDGREAVPAGPATTYRVVASALPDDFDGGRAVEVAGQRLIASNMPLPTRKIGDRDLTFFRVE
jgi:hypothetical protein